MQKLLRQFLVSPFTTRLILAGICGVLAYCLLAWNEHQIIHFLQESGHVPNVVELQSKKLDASDEGKLVHFTAPLTVDSDMADPDFSIRTKAVKLVRQVTMLQWQEKHLNHEEQELSKADNRVQSVGYQKVWSMNLIDSHSFLRENRDQYSNPIEMPYKTSTFIANNVHMGPYLVANDLLQVLDGSRVLDLASFDLTQYIGSAENSIHHDGPNIYLGLDPDNPHIGDQRIEFSIILPQTVSVLATVHNGVLQTFQAPHTKSIAVMRIGNWAAEQLFPKLHQISPVIDWFSRLSALLLLTIAAWLLLHWNLSRQTFITSLWVGLAAECLLFSGLWARENGWLASMVMVCAVIVMMIAIRAQSNPLRPQANP